VFNPQVYCSQAHFIQVSNFFKASQIFHSSSTQSSQAKAENHQAIGEPRTISIELRTLLAQVFQVLNDKSLKVVQTSFIEVFGVF
jgi:hypothetical protein